MFVIFLLIFIICLLFFFFYTINYCKSKEDFEKKISNLGCFFEDSYIHELHNHIFNENNKEQFNVTVNYHYMDLKKVKYEKNYFNLILDGEPNDVNVSEYDLIITTKKDLARKNNQIFVPFFIQAFIEGKNLYSHTLLLKKELEPMLLKTEFCCFMYSNCDENYPGVINRKKFLNRFNELSGNRVTNLGRCYNDNYLPNKNWKSNLDIYKPFKFVIAFENKEIEGYVTEKLIMPMMARAIPIYLGAPDVSKYFNPKSFISVHDFPNFDACIAYVLRVDSDNDLYVKFLNEPFLHHNLFNEAIFSPLLGGQFYEHLETRLPGNIKNIMNAFNFYYGNVYFTTFADTRLYSHERIVKEAKDSYFFNKIIPYSPKELDKKFKTKHTALIENNKRGYGYWIWKPYIVKETLKQMDINDIVMYADSGCTINRKGQDRIKFYYNCMKQYDIICFQICFFEKDWSKMDTINKLFNSFKEKFNYNQDLDFILDQHQITSSCFLIKKNDKTIDFINEWHKIMTRNYNLIDDSPSSAENLPGFKENRHDQTVFSLLIRLYSIFKDINILVLDDNFNDKTNDFLLADGSPRPLIPSRIK